MTFRFIVNSIIKIFMFCSNFEILLLSSVQLQKSAVLQKTIDYIRHLENTIRRLSEENEQLKEALANGEHYPDPACVQYNLC